MITFDIETTGLSIDSKIHCIGIKQDNEPTKIYTSFMNEYSDGTLDKAINILLDADLLVGHNISRYDVRLIEHQFNIKLPPMQDTLVISKLIWTKDELANIDYSLGERFPKDLICSYSLKAFGHRLNDFKGEYSDWTRLTKEMTDYCKQDVELTYKLYLTLKSMGNFPTDKVLDLEQKVSTLLAEQQEYGVYFDIDKARELATNIRFRMFSIESNLTKVFKHRFLPDGPVKCKEYSRREWIENKSYSVPKLYPFELARFKNGKVKLVKRTYFDKPMKSITKLTSGEYQPIKLTKFNPSSRNHIEIWLNAMYGWKSDSFTPNGNSKVDADTLSSLDYPEAKLLVEFLKLSKDYSQLAGTANSMIEQYNPKTHSIHHKCDNLGTNTRRATHSSPNISQTPTTEEFRSLYTCPPGYKFVGADINSQEVKVLAHFLYPYDNGAYDDTIEKGDKSKGTDIHSMNMKAMGLSSRDDAKTGFFGILYGSSATRVGYGLLTDPNTVVDYTEEEYARHKERIENRLQELNGKLYFPIAKDQLIEYSTRLIEQAIYGERIINNLIANTVGYKELLATLAEEAKDGYITGIDGHKFTVRSLHSALNLLIQSTSAVMAKMWMLEIDRLIKFHKLNAHQVIWSHDEVQFCCREEDAEILTQILADSIITVSKQMNLNNIITCNPKIGNNWYECH